MNESLNVDDETIFKKGLFVESDENINSQKIAEKQRLEDLYIYQQWRSIGKRITVMYSIQNGSDPPCIVTNVVTYMELNMKQNQKDVALHAKHILPVFFDPKIFAFSQQPVNLDGYPPVKVMFFSGIKVIILGGLSEDHNRLVAWAKVRYLKKMFNDKICIVALSTRNIVANVDMPFEINLKNVADKLQSMATFDPVLIDCCRVKSKYKGSRRVLIFGTGSMLLIGSKTYEELYELYIEACEIAHSHRSVSSTHKGVSQKYEQKKAVLTEDNIRLTNIQIENAFVTKRNKVSKGKKEAVAKIQLDMFDETFETANMISNRVDYMQIENGAIGELNGPKFLPYNDIPMLEYPK